MERSSNSIVCKADLCCEPRDAARHWELIVVSCTRTSGEEATQPSAAAVVAWFVGLMVVQARFLV